jgi:hypothetical protein
MNLNELHDCALDMEEMYDLHVLCLHHNNVIKVFNVTHTVGETEKILSIAKKRNISPMRILKVPESAVEQMRLL